jgi:hypothetical protein
MNHKAHGAGVVLLTMIAALAVACGTAAATPQQSPPVCKAGQNSSKAKPCTEPRTELQVAGCLKIAPVAFMSAATGLGLTSVQTYPGKTANEASSCYYKNAAYHGQQSALEFHYYPAGSTSPKPREWFARMVANSAKFDAHWLNDPSCKPNAVPVREAADCATQRPALGDQAVEFGHQLVILKGGTMIFLMITLDTPYAQMEAAAQAVLARLP